MSRKLLLNNQFMISSNSFSNNKTKIINRNKNTKNNKSIIKKSIHHNIQTITRICHNNKIINNNKYRKTYYNPYNQTKITKKLSKMWIIMIFNNNLGSVIFVKKSIFLIMQFVKNVI